jgi:hypothetical protein
MVEYIVIVQAAGRRFSFLMPAVPADEFEALLGRLTGKRVRGTGTVTAHGADILKDTRLDILQ